MEFSGAEYLFDACFDICDVLVPEVFKMLADHAAYVPVFEGRGVEAAVGECGKAVLVLRNSPVAG